MQHTLTISLALLLLILVSPSLVSSNSEVDIEVYIDDSTVAPEPLAFGHLNDPNTRTLYPFGMAVSDDGSFFVSAADPYWRSYRGSTAVVLASWNGNGLLLWAHHAWTDDWVINGLAIVDDNLLVTGAKSGDLFLGAYGLDGSAIWNITWDWGSVDYGFTEGLRVGVLGGETIMVSGWSNDYSDDSFYYFLAEFNMTGYPLGHEMFELFPSPCFGADTVYLIANDSMQARSDLNTILWKRTMYEYRPIRGSDQGLYSVYHNSLFHATMDIVAYNASIPAVDLNASVTWANSEHVTYNQSGYSYDITPDGDLLFLIGADNDQDALEVGWYATLIHRNGSVSNGIKILNGTWYSVRTRVAGDRIYTAGSTQEYGIVMARFSTNQFSLDIGGGPNTTSTSTTTQGIAVTEPMLVMSVAAGVIVFDVALIIFLKKRVAS